MVNNNEQKGRVDMGQSRYGAEDFLRVSESALFCFSLPMFEKE